MEAALVCQLHLKLHRAPSVLIHLYVVAQTGKHMPQLTQLPVGAASKVAAHLLCSKHPQLPAPPHRNACEYLEVRAFIATHTSTTSLGRHTAHMMLLGRRMQGTCTCATMHKRKGTQSHNSPWSTWKTIN